MRLLTNVKVGLAVIIISLLLIFVLIPTIPHAQDMPTFAATGMNPKFFPAAIATGMIFLSFVLIVLSYLAPRVSSESVASIGKKEMTRVGITAILGLVYVFLVYLLGYLISTIVILGLLLWFYGERRWTVILPTAIGIPWALFYIFSHVLMLLMPRALLFR